MHAAGGGYEGSSDASPWDWLDIFPESGPYESLKDGEALLLCSDGLILDKSDQTNQNPHPAWHNNQSH